MHSTAYDKDFYSWSVEQATLLENRQFDALDIEHLVEELNIMSARERRELLSRLRVLLMHLLKWEYQPTRRGNSWRLTIKTQAEDIQYIFEQSPSLKRYLPEIQEKSYKQARRLASQETGLPINTFPNDCPYVFEEAISGNLYPGDNEEESDS